MGFEPPKKPAEEEQAQEFEAKVVLDKGNQQTLMEAGGALMRANTLVLDPTDPASMELATQAHADQVAFARRATQIDELRKELAAPFRVALEKLQNRFKPTIEGLTEASNIIKGKLGNYQRQREAIAAEAQRKAEAEARAVREKAEREAAAARAAQEQREREARQRAAAAEAEARAQAEAAERARQEGDVKAAKEAEAKARAAAAERARQEEVERQAQAEADRVAREKLAKAEAEAQATQAAARASQEVMTTRVGGMSMRENWVAELLPDTDADAAKEAIICAIAGIEKLPAARRDLLVALTLDDKAIRQIAKAQKKNTDIPGFKVRNAPIDVSRKT